ncbi:MAG: hypothetical protein ACR2NN_29285 [Bryobacteraceae bacterium]
MINPRNGLLAVGFAVLAVVAVAGWARKPASAPQASYYDQNGQPVYGATQPVSVNQPCVPASGDVNSRGYQPAVYSTPYQDDRSVSDRYILSIHRPVRVISRQSYVQESAPVYTARDVVRTPEGRSKGKSAAIVAGSAAGGAAIGAIAGGGKGAGIGALAGGGAGFIYDRLTHNHR